MEMTMNARSIAVVFLILSASTASAAGIKVTNHSGLPIDEMFVSKPGKKAWGKNIMEAIPDGALDDGKSVVIPALKEGTFDLRISAPDDGVLCYMRNVTIKAPALELTPAMGKSCT
ncbi:hypothetical protein [Aestuariivirga sp.]|uniref:hypothetical protein n=1 Tax=Aestuariivirga sp. TaxID=2650926 RepID=UPI0039E30C7D